MICIPFWFAWVATSLYFSYGDNAFKQEAESLTDKDENEKKLNYEVSGQRKCDSERLYFENKPQTL